MTTTTMHFGPEWMRTKGSTRPAPSPPLATSPVPPGNSTYSALVTPTTNPPSEGRDVAHPFRYSKEEMLRIYKEGGGRGGLGLEVERWEGIVREIGYEPVGLKEMSESEKKLFAGPLNSEVRRRQSSDYLSLNTTGLGDRPKLNHVGSATGSPMRERIGSFMGRRRDSTDQTPLTIPRKLSLSNMQGGLLSPREGALPSPRVRVPGFDGVLSETWSARRRNADSNKANNGLNKSDKEGEGDAKGPENKEQGDAARDPQNDGAENGGGPTKTANGAGDANASTAANQLDGQLSKLSINGQPDTNPQPAVDASKPPPGLGDLASIEWSYLDPQGNVQGPFRADLMQRWFNEGYFTPDLLMKRTHLDNDWTPVAELVRRAGDQPVFLTPLVHAVAPPGLNRRLDTVVDSGVPERNQHSPYQPVPTRNLRSSTLDSYLVNGSNVPESPSSSFGGRFTNGSPDPAIFENRIGGQLGFNQGAESRMPFASGPGQRRATLNDSVEPVFGNRAFGNLGAVRTQGLDGMGFGGNESPSVFNDSLTSPFGQRTVQDHAGLNGHTGSSALNGAEIGPIGGIHSNQGTPSRVLARDAFGRDDMHGGSFSNGSSPFISHAQPAFPQTPLSHYAGQDQRSLHSMTPISDRQSISSLPFAHPLQQPFAQNPTFGTTQSPWHPPENATYRRPGPFDPVHPTASNTFVVQPIAPTQSFSRNAPGGMPAEQSPWQTPVKPVNNDPWGAATSNLTTANLGQHDEQQRQDELHQQQQHQQPQAAPEPAQSEPVVTEAEPQAQATPTPAAAPAAPSPTEPAPQKTRRKSSAQPAQTTQQAPKVSPPAPAAKPPSPTPAPAPAPAAENKPAWGMDDEKKVKAPGAPLNLREIQEAEAKKLEARKAAERERERAARAAASAQADDFQPFTASWGLPTSQAGARNNNNAAKETPAASPFAAASPAPAPPVWTNAAKAPVAKKTMKEIQEEEERRKKLAAAKEKESMAAAAKRGYAETTTKPATPVQQVGGAWTTVGSGGKTAAAAVAAARPATTPAAVAKPAPATPAVSSPAAAPRPAAAATPRPAAVALKATPSKEDNSIAPGPSLEFLKWLSESLKGLNSSVNLEELTSMLLSFPLDPDQTTMEIISELIYASSTTLDGRRFAAEFVSKRKADATARPKGATASSASAKPVSIADVVKAQPKPAQNEWGGFKVVNKKKKGGRA
ncbi:hypothetical protein PYCCODRAFT_1405668 [Trametes coccinea BRFM310]|uniref:GYF domain-containing protein n=1 Tax=Trametes coccinea (strain BRFM310) TaxID=1353009 RepID=A0A1Y2IYW2_TRAC3|nr:hypothetical protein PYCCODRAFT_1405668 [Trametes coccinea BRFM310]